LGNILNFLLADCLDPPLPGRKSTMVDQAPFSQGSQLHAINQLDSCSSTWIKWPHL